MRRSKEVDVYIKNFPKGTQTILNKVRSTIRKAVPQAEETMSYGIPTFRLNGNLVHFGGFKKHIGFFPTSSSVLKFKKELLPYKTSKGTVQFPLDKSIPFDLIYKITKFRVIENSKK